LTVGVFGDLIAPMSPGDSSGAVTGAAVTRQLGASLAMIDGAMAACPDGLWDDGSREHAFWYIAYHALFWLDLHLHGSAAGFRPPAPFGLEELDPAGVLPPRALTRAELRGYAEHCRRKVAEAMVGLTGETAARRCRFPWGEVPYVELLLYAMRHVQHHAGQLNLLLRQRTDVTPRWVARGP
jgi:hypothetical protein